MWHAGVEMLKNALCCHVGDDACQDDGGKRANGEIEEDDFERKEHAANGRSENRTDSCRRSAANERGQVRLPDLEELPDPGADPSADLHNWPLRASRPARTDGERARQDLLERHQRVDASSAAQHGFNDVHHAMSFPPADHVTRKQADGQPAHRWENDKQRQAYAIEDVRGEELSVEQITDGADEFMKRDGRPGAENTD